MHRYHLYIVKSLIGPLLLIAFSLTSIAWLTQALRFVDFIINRGVSVGTFATLTILMIPSLLQFILPIALFCAVLYTYHKLTGDSELLVMSGAGLSRWQLAKPALTVAAACCAFAYFSSLYLSPLAYRQFKEMQSFLRDNYASLLLQEGVFNNPVEGLTVFIRDRDRDGTLRGIFVHDERQNKQSVTMMAEVGQLVQSPSGPRFNLLHGNRQGIDKERGTLSLLNFEQYALDISFYTKRAENRPRTEEEMFLHELFDRSHADPERVDKMHAEGNHRITWPILNLTLTLVAVSFLLSGEFNRRGQRKRVILSAVTGLAVVGLAVFLAGAVARTPLLMPLMYINVAGIAVIAGLKILRDEPLGSPMFSVFFGRL